MQRHDDASKEVTRMWASPTFASRGASAQALPSTPTPSDKKQGVVFGLTADEKSEPEMSSRSIRVDHRPTFIT
jgi:hypothetical protein